METNFIGNEIIKLQSVDSTNNYAANMLLQDVLSDGAVILAYNQEKGKGQRGNSWVSEPGRNLTFSIALKNVRCPVAEQARLIMITSLSLIDFLSSHKIDCNIKWPNDILAGKKKIAGILVENSLKGERIMQSIIGIGLNVNQEEFGVFQATSMKKEQGQEFELDILLADLLKCFETRFMSLHSLAWGTLKKMYLEKLYGYETEIRYLENDEEKTGVIRDIDKTGRVIIESEATNRAYDLRSIKLLL